MRRSLGLVLVVVGASLVIPNTLQARQVRRTTSPSTAAKQKQGGVEVTVEQQRRAAAAQQAAAADEQQVSARVRWIQSQMLREEKLLQQRIAYAQRIRQKGLDGNDQKTLDQAETYERQSLAAYEQKLRQFERMLQASTGSTTSSRFTNPPGKTTKRAPAQAQPRPTRNRSSAKRHPYSRLIRRR